MCLPVPVSPVNATRRISGWVTSASPITEPRPVTTLSTPAGSPASWKSSATFSVASGVVDAGLTTTVLPGSERRADLRPHQRQRVVVRHDRGDRADRTLEHHSVRTAERRRQVLVRAADLRREVGVVVHAVDEVLELARGLDRRLALLVRERLDDLVLVLGDEVECLPDDLGALLGVRPRPLAEGARPPPARRARPRRRRRPGPSRRRPPSPGSITSSSSVAVASVCSPPISIFTIASPLSRSAAPGSGGRSSRYSAAAVSTQRRDEPSTSFFTTAGTPAATTSGRDLLPLAHDAAGGDERPGADTRASAGRSRPWRSGRRPRRRIPPASPRGRPSRWRR